jgi:hypothetical protein
MIWCPLCNTQPGSNHRYHTYCSCLSLSNTVGWSFGLCLRLPDGGHFRPHFVSLNQDGSLSSLRYGMDDDYVPVPDHLKDEWLRDFVLDCKELHEVRRVMTT